MFDRRLQHSQHLEKRGLSTRRERAEQHVVRSVEMALQLLDALSTGRRDRSRTLATVMVGSDPHDKSPSLEGAQNSGEVASGDEHASGDDGRKQRFTSPTQDRQDVGGGHRGDAGVLRPSLGASLDGVGEGDQIPR